MTITLQIALFGIFRNSGASEITLDVPVNSDLVTVKKQLAVQFARDYPNFSSTHLIETAVLADETRVLNANERLTHSCKLAILPPVCGG